MIKKFSSLNIFWQTVICSSLLLVIAVGATTWCYFYNLMEIPNGIALGIAINLCFDIVFAVLEEKENKKSVLVINTILTVSRVLVMGGIMLLVAFLYYKQNLKIFNIFALIGGYTATLVVLLIMAIRKGKKSGTA